ncbi:hypothetical protein ACFL3S_09155 [Gemmatimonadota bacterium]
MSTDGTAPITSDPGSRRATQKVAATIAVSFITLLLAVIVGESVLPASRELEIPVNNVPYPYVMFRPPSGATWHSPGPSPSSRSGEHAVEHTSSESFRIAAPGLDPARTKPGGIIRVVVLGGSTVRIGTTQEVALPGALEIALHTAHPDLEFEVINAGIIAAISRQELVFLITTVVDYAPDILVVYDGINDSGQMLYYEDRPDFPYTYRVTEAAWEEYVEGRTDPLWRLLLHRSKILERIFPNRFGARSVLHPIPAQRLIEDGGLRRGFAQAHAGNWAKMLRVAQAYGIRSVFVLQPISVVPLATSGSIGPEDSPELYANYLVYEDMQEATQDLADRQSEFRVLDLSDLLQPEAFYDGAHVYDDVNQIIAREIAGFLETEIEAGVEGIRNPRDPG